MPDRGDSQGSPPPDSDRPEPGRRLPRRSAARSVAEELRAIDERLAAAEDARAAEGEELLTRMAAIEVLIEQLDGRVVELERDASGARDVPGDLELRVGALEYAADALGPLTAVPATIAALEQELIALGERLDARDARDEVRDGLVRREVEARVSIARSDLDSRYAERWEGIQDAIEAGDDARLRLCREARLEPQAGDDARLRLEARLTTQAQAASSALAELEERVNASVEALAGRLTAAAGAQGEIAESTVARLESLETDIAAIEAEFGVIAGRISRAQPEPEPGRAEPTEGAADRREPSPDAAWARFSGTDRPRPATPAEPAGPVNLNEANFEVLRSLGCSVTQTARILAARKVRGGFGSPEDLAEVPGLPKEFRLELISRLTV